MKTKEEIISECAFKQFDKHADPTAFNDLELKFIFEAMEEYGKQQYNQGILDLLDKSDGLDMNFQANKLLKQ